MAETRRYGWGLIGPGRFAREFAAELAAVDRADCVAVASRSGERAAAFADDFGFARWHDDYDALFDDPAVEIVYIVVPHAFHHDLALRAVRAGKAVVCEKPLTISAARTSELTAAAREAGVFLMEAMKTGFLPAIRRAREWIEAGDTGTPQILRADFCFHGPVDPEDRLMNPDLGGGCIHDVGIYPLYLARHFLGEIEDLQATGRLASTGVEETAAIVTRHTGGACATLTSSFRSAEAMDAVLLGSAGQIAIPRFHAATTATLERRDGSREDFSADHDDRLSGEIRAVHEALDAGLLECPGHTHTDSLALATLMDTALRQVRG